MIPFLVTLFSAPPNNVVAPSVTGTGYVGYTLTCSPGTWNNAVSFTYQWQRNGVNIGGATASTYVVTLADEGVPVRCVVTATGNGSSISANSNAIEQWVPTDLGAALVNWWDSEDSSTITIATGVSQWNDKGSLGDNLTQGTGTRQPAYSATGWDGSRPAITFDGTDDVLAITSSKNRVRNVSGVRVAQAWKSDATRVSESRILHINGPSQSRLTVGMNASPGSQFNMGARRLDADSYTFASPANFTDDLAAHVRLSRFRFATAQAEQRLDGTATIGSAYTAGSTSDTASASLAIGGSTTGSNTAPGRLHSLLVAAGEGTDAENEKIEAYFAWRARLVANLPGGHPFKTVAPTP